MKRGGGDIVVIYRSIKEILSQRCLKGSIARSVKYPNCGLEIRNYLES